MGEEQPHERMGISRDEYQRIEALIGDVDSPVGIDAKRTHVLIIQKLLEIERRLDRLEQQQPPTHPDQPRS